MRCNGIASARAAGPRRRFAFRGWTLTAALCACSLPPRPAEVWIHVSAGEPIAAVAESLAVHRVVGSAAAFARVAQDRTGTIAPGYYVFRPPMVMWRVLRTLHTARPRDKRVVVRERMTLDEVAERLHVTLGLPVEDVLAAAHDAALKRRVGTQAETIEGYLPPGTYYVYGDASARSVLQDMVERFAGRWDPAWNARLDTLALTRDEIVTLASIIEGEMPKDGDRFTIASVYHNRLAQGMRLQADPTVVYGLGTRRRLTYDDYDVESDYNTYAFRGLPPGPIGEPTSASLEAALYPAETDYLYFVGDSEGRHLFSRTYTEHLRTIRELRGR